MKHQIFLGKLKNGEMDEERSIYRRKEKRYKIIVRKPKREKPFGRPRHR
jgi:hypothetical protein